MVGELRDQAIADLALTVQSDFGQRIRIATDSKDSEFKTFTGNSNDIHQSVDPETGQMFSGRQAHAILVYKEVFDHFQMLPKKQWRVQFLDISPNEFRIKDIMPDATLGILKLIIGK